MGQGTATCEHGTAAREVAMLRTKSSPRHDLHSLQPGQHPQRPQQRQHMRQGLRFLELLQQARRAATAGERGLHQLRACAGKMTQTTLNE